MNEVILKFTVPEAFHGVQAKYFLKKRCRISARLLASLKRTYLGISREGMLLKATDKIYAGDVIMIKLPQDENKVIPIEMPLDIRFEDEHIMVVNKPYNMPVHPTHNHICDTLANGVAFYLTEKDVNTCFRALNRLDKDTTGLVLIAKHSYAAAQLAENTEKLYTAVCEGLIENPGTVDAPISILEGHTIQRTAGASEGVKAVTHYKPIKFSNGHTMVECALETGRTHQIRVHMSYIGHPLAGDDMYGGSLKYIERQALHCGKISFVHPVSLEKITLTSEIPNDMKNIFSEAYVFAKEKGYKNVNSVLINS